MHGSTRRYWDLIATYLRPQRGRVALLAIMLLSGIALQVFNPQVMRYFIDTAMGGTGGDRTAELVAAAALFLVIALLNQILSVATTYTGENVSWTATNALRADLALHALRLDMGFHKARTPGEMIERIDGDVTALSNVFSRFVILLLGNLLLLIGVIVVLFLTDWRAGAAIAAFALFTLVMLHRLRSFGVNAWKAERQASAEFYGLLEERISGTEDIRANGGGEYALRRFYEKMRAHFHRRREATIRGSMLWGSHVLLFGLGNAIAFAVGAYLYGTGAITLGTVYVIFSYVEQIFQPLNQIMRQISDVQRAVAGADRIHELLGTTSKLQEGSGEPIPAGALSVEFQDVSFGYVEDTAVLRELNFNLRPGAILGLLGRTGSGKTTVTRMLFRLYDPDGGAVRLGGVDLRDARMSEIPHRVGMVTQEVQLFNATVRDNLTFFSGEISDERILTALRELGLWEWYSSLPDGLDTMLETGGGGLSAGEAQLLAFTRVFLADPGLVILDEASSRLDPATEQLIERAVSKLLVGRTAIIVAHRLGTVQRADEIMIMENGGVREHGERRLLAANPASRFSQLLRTGMEEALA